MSTGRTSADTGPAMIGPALLANGATVSIVPAGPDDLDRLRVFYERLSDSSMYDRFFGVRHHLPDSELRTMVATQLPGHVSLLALLDGELIGIGEYIGDVDHPLEAEVAFAVADDHRREGVATLLLERLAVIANACGLRTFTACTLAGNTDMQLVFRTVGLPVESRDEDLGSVVDVTLDISCLDGLARLTAERHEHASYVVAQSR